LASPAYAACDLTPKFSYKTKDLSVSFDNRSLGDFTNVKWTFGDGSSSTDLNASHYYDKEGMYIFTLTIYNDEGCSETFEGKVYVFDTNNPQVQETEEEEIEQKSDNSNLIANVMTDNSQITNYPNPFNESTTIQLDLNADDDVSVNVYDMSGKLVAILADETMVAGRREIVFTRDNLASGTYLVSARTSKGILTRKMTIN